MANKKSALITGILGQDGSYLAEFLIGKGYVVHGLVLSAEKDLSTRHNVPDEVVLYEGDLRDNSTLKEALEKANPDEVYNLAGITDLGAARKHPEMTIEINYYGLARLVNEAIVVNPNVRVFQAGSAQMFERGDKTKNESTTLVATEPYSEAKILAQQDVVEKYRNENNVFICSAYLFNHESPRRDNRFVTTKIIETLKQIASGEDTVLEIGNLESKRDWGFAGDYVEAMWMMLQADLPQDYVLATGVMHTVRDFVEEAAKNLNISISWEGKGLDEVGKDKTGKIIVKVNPDFYSEEKNVHAADISKIKKELGWEPKTSFEELVSLMAT